MNTQSIYGAQIYSEEIVHHTIAMIVDNEPGVLAKVVGMFSGRGYNIESLTVAETDHTHHLSRITLVVSGTPMTIEQIKNQLARLVPVHEVGDLTLFGDPVERELALVKMFGNNDDCVKRGEELGARTVSRTPQNTVFEFTGVPAEIDDFVHTMREKHNLDAVSRTGIAAISRSGNLAGDTK